MSDHRQKKKHLVLIATTPFAVRCFLRPYIRRLKRDFEITVITNLEVSTVNMDLPNCVNLLNINIERNISLKADLCVLLRLMYLFAKLRPLVVHSITPKAGLIGMLAAFLTAVPHRFHIFTGQVWVTKRGFLRYLLKHLDWLTAKLASAVLADSASQRLFLIEKKIVRHEKIRVLGNGSVCGVDTEKFKPDPVVRELLRGKHKISDETIIFLFLGRLTKAKGVSDLIDVVPKIKEKNEDAVFWLVGPNEGQFADFIIDKRIGGDDRSMRWFGPSEKPEAFLQAADVLVLPSYREGFGMVIIEAAACGVPAVAYKIDGVRDAIINDQTGIMVDCGEMEDFEQALLKLASDKEKRKTLGSSARARVKMKFSVELISDEIAKFYKNQLSSKNKR